MVSRNPLLPRLACALLLILPACSHHTDGPVPTLAAPLAPQAACNDQVASVIAISGDMLSPLNDHNLLDTQRLELPQVSLACGRSLETTDSPDCDPARAVSVPNDPDDAGRSDEAWASQQSMSFGICPQGACSRLSTIQPPLLTDWPATPDWPTGVPTGLFDLHVQNRNGHDATLKDALAVVPPPRLDRIEADLLCKDQDNTVKLTGDWFLVVAGQNPDVALVDSAGVARKLDPANVKLADCRDLRHPDGFTLSACKTIDATIPAGFVDLASPTDTFRNFKVVVMNHVASSDPGNVVCHSTTDIELTFVPRPQLFTITPDIACDAQAARTFTLAGAGFLTVDGKLPTIRLDATTILTAAAAADCTDVGTSGFPRERTQSCRTLTLALTQGQIPPVGPGEAPVNYAVTVQNPPPADCLSTPPVDLTIVPPPLVMSVVPDLACTAQGERTFTITGAGFVSVGTSAPTVTITDANGATVSASAVPVDMSCSLLAGPTETVRDCTQLTVTVPGGMLASGLAQFQVENPAPVGCTSSEVVTALIVPPPIVTKVAPAQVCTAQGDVAVLITGADLLTVDGAPPIAHFTDAQSHEITASGGTAGGCVPLPGATETVERCTTLTVTLPRDTVLVADVYAVTVTNPAPAGCTSVNDPQAPVTIVGTPPPTIASFAPATLCAGGGRLSLTGTGFEPGAEVIVGPLQVDSVNVSGPTAATANLGAGLIPGSYSVSLRNPDGCAATAEHKLTVVQGLTAFFADPPTVWNGISTLITVYAANVVGKIVTVGIVPSGGGGNPTSLVVTNAQGGRAQALVPSGTPAGTYDVIVTDNSCTAILPAGLKVVQNTSFAITKVTPAYGSTQTNTGVTVSSNGAFVATPRAWLSSGAGAATPITGLSFVDGSTLTATVPAGTPVLPKGQSYDLIVVNPDGTVGVLKAAFTEIQNLAPIITAVNPAMVFSGAPFTVVGRNFANNVQVTAACFNVDGTDAGAASLIQGALTTCGANQCIAITGGVYPGGYCLITATNPDDKAAYSYSALVLENNALKTGAWAPASSMTVGRRAFGQATVQATPAARFIYAAGGDAGTEKGALGSVEAVQVDVTGHMAKWLRLPNALPASRTFLGLVAVDRFLYAIGGSDGNTAVTSIDRAYVLNPADAITFSDLNLDLPAPGEKGVPAGIFYYRVAPVMGNGDPYNPGGENLPSDPLVIQAPALANGAYITLSWPAVSGAAGYRVYRSPTPNMGGGSEVLIADAVVATSYQDRYASPILVNGAVVKPLPIGSTGLWRPSGIVLRAPRSGAAIAETVDPKNALVHYVYVMGGNAASEANPVALASTEYFTVAGTANDFSQTLMASVAGPSLLTARWQTAGISQTIDGANYVWAAGGLPGPLATVEGSAIGNNGVPGAFVVTGGNPAARAGLAAIAATNELVLFGGQGAAPSTDGVHGLLNSPPPTVKNFNNLPNVLGTARYLMGTAVQSSFMFVCGGVTVPGMPPTATCETSVF